MRAGGRDNGGMLCRAGADRGRGSDKGVGAGERGVGWADIVMRVVQQAWDKGGSGMEGKVRGMSFLWREGAGVVGMRVHDGGGVM